MAAAECISCGSWTQYGELCIHCRKQRVAIVVEYMVVAGTAANRRAGPVRVIQ
ncbi:MAG: hypothetical protein QXX64_03960 [Nitrososphaera sp.]|uniref:Uncharacterized protein n=1 Tax=Nitrososphaera gargensis (strain Ga9.2) TaxID=1237085 RepID=K0IP08_NITGG|nr:hypothetical protein [Candidatus Nitrososphaera gargensis]AFU60299.1 hypothetical protein Ngar_c33840 [Candidatus Nitrososphaera gargensis Ga9.2]